MLGWLADTTAAGIYIVANQITYVTILTLIAMNQLIGPTISTLYVKQDFDGLQKVVTLTSWWIFGLSFALTTPIFLFSDVILHAVFGGRFAEGAMALRVILIGQLLNCSFGSIVFLLTMTGHHSKATLVFGSMAALSIGLNAVLIPLFGLEGAAIAKALTLFGWNGIMAVIVYRNLQIVPGIYNTSYIKLLGRIKMARPHARQTPDSLSGD